MCRCQKKKKIFFTLYLNLDFIYCVNNLSQKLPSFHKINGEIFILKTLKIFHEVVELKIQNVFNYFNTNFIILLFI